MNAVMNRKLLVLLGPVAGLVMFAATIMMASWLMSREYKIGRASCRERVLFAV